MQAGQIIIIII